MRKAVVSASERADFMRRLREFRSCDCCWPRQHSGRPRCGRCFACDVLTAVELRGARVQ